jgi:hypothetical protein
MKISRYYDQIVGRALELLNHPDGFNGHSREEIRSWGPDWRLVMRNNVGCALVRARDERLAAEGIKWPSVDKTVQFSGPNFDKARAGIMRWFRLKQWQMAA